MKTRAIFLAVFFFISLACSATLTINPQQTYSQPEQSIGFDFSSQSPSSPDGDRAAPTHVFIHKYPFPTDGFVTGVTFVNDSDSKAEEITLLILRPLGGGWEVIHRVDLSEDDRPSTKTGITTLSLGTSLAVEKGDIFAHWQFGKTGPIPLNDEHLSFDGLSVGKFGLDSKDIEEGHVLTNENFSGGRDYFINLIFEETP